MKISGHLDLCGPTLIEGWLYSDAWQDEPIRLQVYVGTNLIGEVLVNRFRQDLQDAGFGNGHCGFSYVIPTDAGLTSMAETRLRIIGTPVYLLPNESTSIADFTAPVLVEDSEETEIPPVPDTTPAESASTTPIHDTQPKKIERKGFSFR